MQLKKLYDKALSWWAKGAVATEVESISKEKLINVWGRGPLDSTRVAFGRSLRYGRDDTAIKWVRGMSLFATG